MGVVNMYYIFNKSCIGYSHLKSKKPCQDYSASYKDNERMIVTCCDGHGGAQYIRSKVGSKLASDAVINVFKSIDAQLLRNESKGEVYEKIKLLVLCEYNTLVEKDIKKRPIRSREFKGLKDKAIDTLRYNPMSAYGTTLSGAMLYKDKYIVVSIGDSEALGIHDGHLVKLFDNSDDPAGNITYSMCQEDAYQYLRVVIIDKRELDGVLLCTDGLSSPYQSYESFDKSFIRIYIKDLLRSKSVSKIDKQIDKIASSLGVGDDVSLSFIINDKTPIKYFEKEN